MSQSRVEKWAEKLGVNLIYIRQADGCRSSNEVEYALAISFSDYQNKRPAVQELLNFANKEHVYLDVMKPTMTELGIEPELLNIRPYCKKLIEKPPADLDLFYSMMEQVIFNYLQKVADEKFNKYYIHRDEKELCLGGVADTKALADNPAEIKEIAAAIKESLKLIAPFLQSPPEETVKWIEELKNMRRQAAPPKHHQMIAADALKLIEGAASAQGLFRTPLTNAKTQASANPSGELKTLNMPRI